MYIFDTHYGKSSLADEDTGIILSWTNGDFERTHVFSTDSLAMALAKPEGEELSDFLARKEREMCDYALKEYPEII